jgi:hypothetical protein
MPQKRVPDLRTGSARRTDRADLPSESACLPSHRPISGRASGHFAHMFRAGPAFRCAPRAAIVFRLAAILYISADGGDRLR